MVSDAFNSVSKLEAPKFCAGTQTIMILLNLFSVGSLDSICFFTLLFSFTECFIAYYYGGSINLHKWKETGENFSFNGKRFSSFSIFHLQ